MADLAALQKAFGAAILAPDEAAGTLDGAIRGGALKPHERLRVYRNNFRQGLTDGIAAIFPVVAAFVGDVFLKAALRRYILASPPAEPVLHRYGAGFADFLDTFEPAAKVPYIADLARLEWAVHELQNACEAETLDADAALVAADEGRLALGANVRLIDSQYALLGLWMVGTRQLPPEAVDPGRGAQAAAVVLADGRIDILPLERELRTLAIALADGAGAGGKNQPAAVTALADRRMLAPKLVSRG